MTNGTTNYTIPIRLDQFKVGWTKFAHHFKGSDARWDFGLYWNGIQSIDASIFRIREDNSMAISKHKNGFHLL
jgi:hypothetical protein